MDWASNPKDGSTVDSRTELERSPWVTIPAETARVVRFWRNTTESPVASLVLYVLFAVWSTWPLVCEPLTVIPGGIESSGTVPLFNLWTIWWNSDRALHGFRGYWNAPIFHPERATFAFSEPQPITLAVAPVIWLTGSRALAFNAYLLGSLILNGIFARRLLRTMGVSGGAALFGGAAMVLLPIVHWQVDVVQLVPLWGILWTWDTAFRAFCSPSPGRGALLGCAFGCSFLTCAHHGLSLGLLLAASIWALPKQWRSRETWYAFATAGLVSVALILPIALPMHLVMKQHRFERDEDTVFRLSTFVGDYTAPPGLRLIDSGLLAARPEWRLSPGLLVSLMGVAGIVIGIHRRRTRRLTIFLALTAFLAIVFSLGPNLRFGTYRPWWTLTIIPGMAQVRNVFRFAYFMQMATVLLAFQGLHLAWRRVRLARGVIRIAGGVVLTLFGLLAIFETRPVTPRRIHVPDFASNRQWIDFLREERPAEAAVLFLPFEEGNFAPNFELTTRWMYLQSWHHAPTPNGYSGFFPPAYFELREAVRKNWGSNELWNRLSELGIGLIVVDRKALAASNFKASFADGKDLSLLLADNSAGVDVYRLPHAPEAPSTDH